MAGEAFSVIDECDSVAELDAQLAPAVDDFFAIGVGKAKPMVQRDKKSPGERDSVTDGPAFYVNAGSGSMQFGWEGAFLLVAVYPDANNISGGPAANS